MAWGLECRSGPVFLHVLLQGIRQTFLLKPSPRRRGRFLTLARPVPGVDPYFLFCGGCGSLIILKPKRGPFRPPLRATPFIPGFEPTSTSTARSLEAGVRPRLVGVCRVWGQKGFIRFRGGRGGREEGSGLGQILVQFLLPYSWPGL